MRDQVFRNIIQCQQLWVSHQLSPKHGVATMFNPRTGELQPSINFHKEHFTEEGWLQAEIKLSEKRTPHTYLADKRGRPLNFTALDAMAAEIANETLKAIDELVKIHYRSHLHVEPPISRLEAERLLKGKRVGTYMVNDADPSIESVAKSLSETNETIVALYLLTLLEEKERPVQSLLVASKWGWTILQDLPDLRSPIYQYSRDFTSLLATLSPSKKFLLKKAESKRREK